MELCHCKSGLALPKPRAAFMLQSTFRSALRPRNEEAPDLGVLAFLFVLIATDPQDNLTLVESGVRAGASGTRFVTGTFRNNTDRSCAHVQVEIDRLKEDGSVVGRTLANTTNLGGGEAWNFDAPIVGEDAVRIRVVKLTCVKTLAELRHGVNGWTAEPRDRYYQLVGLDPSGKPRDGAG